LTVNEQSLRRINRLEFLYCGSTRVKTLLNLTVYSGSGLDYVKNCKEVGVVKVVGQINVGDVKNRVQDAVKWLNVAVQAGKLPSNVGVAVEWDLARVSNKPLLFVNNLYVLGSNYAVEWTPDDKYVLYKEENGGKLVGLAVIENEDVINAFKELERALIDDKVKV